MLELYKDLRDEHTAWVQRIHATLFHHGVPQLGTRGVTTAAGRARLQAGEGLSPVGRQAVMVALRVMDALDVELGGLHRQIRTFANRQSGCTRVADPVRGRADHRHGDRGDDGRHPPLLGLPPGDAPHRPGRHRVQLRRQTRPRAPGQAGSTAAALGAVRGGLPGRPHPGAGPRLLRRRQGPHRPQTRRHLRRLQDRPPLASHSARTRRPSLRDGLRPHEERMRWSRPPTPDATAAGFPP